MLSAVYFFPSAQSVPTVSNRLPVRLRPLAIGMLLRRRSHVDQSTSMPLSCNSQRRRVSESRVHAADDIEPRLQCTEQMRQPAVDDLAADVRDADHHRASARRARLRGTQARQPERDGAVRARPLADATLARPIAKAECRLRIRRLGHIAEEQQIRLGQLHAHAPAQVQVPPSRRRKLPPRIATMFVVRIAAADQRFGQVERLARMIEAFDVDLVAEAVARLVRLLQRLYWSGGMSS